MKCLTCQEALRLLHVIYGSQDDVSELLAGVMVSFSYLHFIVVTYSPLTHSKFQHFPWILYLYLYLYLLLQPFKIYNVTKLSQHTVYKIVSTIEC